MSLPLSLLVLALSTSFAADLPPGALPLPQVGAVLNLNGCDDVHALASPWSAGNTVRVLTGQAQAQAICAAAKGELAIDEATAQAIKDRATVESWLLFSAAYSAMTGGPVSYNYVINPDGSQTTHLATGPAGTVHELALIAASLDPQLTGYGQYGAYNQDPNLVGLARMNGVQLGAPVTPGTQATATCGTAEQCQAKIAALQSALANQK